MMDLTPTQIDQLAEMQLRRLEREYQQVLRADGTMTAEIERARRELGTPNLDEVMQEYLKNKKSLDAKTKAGPSEDGKPYEMSDDADDEDSAPQGFQQIGDEDDWVSHPEAEADLKKPLEDPKPDREDEESDEELTTHKGFEKVPEDAFGYMIPGSINVNDFTGVESSSKPAGTSTAVPNTKVPTKSKPITEDPIIIDRSQLESSKKSADPQVVVDTFKNINFEAPKWAKG